jgi:23S rRNA pseudouridine1911/1915/1917 synthase
MGGGEWRIDRTDAGARLDRWLADPLRLGSRGRASVAIARGQVFVSEVEQGPADAARRLNEGEVVRVWIDRPGTASRRGPSSRGGLIIVYEDDQLLVANKPAGLLTVSLSERPGEPALQDLVAAHWRSHGRRRPLAVHRIDRDTSGLVIFAKDSKAWRTLKEQFVRREPERLYVAVVEGTPAPLHGTWRDWLRWDPATLRQEHVARDTPRALEALTAYEVVEKLPRASLLNVQLTTGRRHQIRAQAWLHGVPLVGERMYRDRDSPDVVEFPRQALHAAALRFRHPITGRLVTVEAPPADDLRRLLDELRRTAGG